MKFSPENMAVVATGQASDMDLAEGWVSALLPDVCEINPPKPPANAFAPDTPVTFVPMPAVDADAGAITAPETRLFSNVRSGFTAFREGDIIFAKITPCMENGKAAIARNLSNGAGFGSTEFHVLRSNGAVLPEFVYHFVRQESFRKEAEAEMTGSVGQKRVPTDFLRQIGLPVAPLAEQRRIVAEIEELLAHVNSARAHLTRVARILKRFRQAVLATCSDGESQPLSELLADIKYGTAQKCTPLPTGSPVLRIPNIRDGMVRLDDLKYAKLPPKELAALQLMPGDVLMIRSNGSVSLVGKTALVSEKEAGFAYAGYLMRLRTNRNRVLPEYLNLALQTHNVREQIEIPARSTSGVHNINSKEVLALEINVPDLDTQRNIVRRVEALFTHTGAIEKQVEAATKRAEKLTQAILAKAFRGELVPTEAELARRESRDYEPASGLLARIKTQRATSDARQEPARRLSQPARRKIKHRS